MRMPRLKACFGVPAADHAVNHAQHPVDGSWKVLEDKVTAMEKELLQERERTVHISEQAQKAADALAKAEQKAAASAAASRLRETVWSQREHHLCRQVAQLESALSQARLLAGRSPLQSHSQMAERFTGQSNAVMGDVGPALALDSHASPRDTEADGGVTVVPPSSLMLHPRRTTDGSLCGGPSMCASVAISDASATSFCCILTPAGSMQLSQQQQSFSGGGGVTPAGSMLPSNKCYQPSTSYGGLNNPHPNAVRYNGGVAPALSSNATTACAPVASSVASASDAENSSVHGAAEGISAFSSCTSLHETAARANVLESTASAACSPCTANTVAGNGASPVDSSRRASFADGPVGRPQLWAGPLTHGSLMMQHGSPLASRTSTWSGMAPSAVQAISAAAAIGHLQGESDDAPTANFKAPAFLPVSSAEFEQSVSSLADAKRVVASLMWKVGDESKPDVKRQALADLRAFIRANPRLGVLDSMLAHMSPGFKHIVMSGLSALDEE